jgi:hypothetical protein
VSWEIISCDVPDDALLLRQSNQSRPSALAIKR